MGKVSAPRAFGGEQFQSQDARASDATNLQNRLVGMLFSRNWNPRSLVLRPARRGVRSTRRRAISGAAAVGGDPVLAAGKRLLAGRTTPTCPRRPTRRQPAEADVRIHGAPAHADEPKQRALITFHELGQYTQRLIGTPTADQSRRARRGEGLGELLRDLHTYQRHGRLQEGGRSRSAAADISRRGRSQTTITSRFRRYSVFGRHGEETR